MTRMDYRRLRNHWSRQTSVDLPVRASPQPLAHENNDQQPLNADDQWPKQELQASRHQNPDSAFLSQQQQQRQRNPAPDTTYAGAGVHSEILQTHSSGWNVDSHAPIEMALYNQNDLMHLQTYAERSGSPLTHPSSSHTSSSKHSFYRHHFLTEQHALSNPNRTGHDTTLCCLEEYSPSSVVGDPGMPKPAARSAGLNLRFTPEDDALLVELKETKDLAWKQIVDFFPGRSSGTLQVRYCTKLKAKEISWTEPLLEHLRQALEEYERDRWRIISAKVGNGFSAASCKDKAAELSEWPAG